MLGMPGVLLVLAGNGWMRGVQRTREPVVIVLVANALSAVRRRCWSIRRVWA